MSLKIATAVQIPVENSNLLSHLFNSRLERDQKILQMGEEPIEIKTVGIRSQPRFKQILYTRGACNKLSRATSRLSISLVFKPYLSGI